MYLVITTYSSDYPDVRTFDNEQDARVWLCQTAQNERNIDEIENGWDIDFFCDDDNYAKLVDHFDDWDDITEWYLVEVEDAADSQTVQNYISLISALIRRLPDEVVAEAVLEAGVSKDLIERLTELREK